MILRTYSTFCSSNELLHLLSIRFHVPLPTNRELADRWKRHKVTPVHLRVFNILFTWLRDETPWEALKDSEFVATFKRLLESMEENGFRHPASTIRAKLDVQLAAAPAKGIFPFPAFSSFQNRTGDKETSPDWTVEKIAEELTTYQQKIYNQTSCAALIRHIKEPAAEGSTIHRLLKHSDELGAWITNQITQSDISSGKQVFFLLLKLCLYNFLTPSLTKEQTAEYISTAINIADISYCQHKNLNSLVIIISALQRLQTKLSSMQLWQVSSCLCT